MLSETHGPKNVDVAVIGSGFAGTIIAIKAAQLGLSVGAFDLHSIYPNRFRAEKLETERVQCPPTHTAAPTTAAVDLFFGIFISEVCILEGKVALRKVLRTLLVTEARKPAR